MKQELREKNPNSISKHNKVPTFSVFSKKFQYALMHFILPVAKQKQKPEDSSLIYFRYSIITDTVSEERAILKLKYLDIQRHALIFTGRKKNIW